MLTTFKEWQCILKGRITATHPYNIKETDLRGHAVVAWINTPNMFLAIHVTVIYILFKVSTPPLRL